MSATECDIQKTAILEGLLRVLPETRDAAWRESFLTCLPDACLTATVPEIIQGPDSMPYLGLRMPEPGQQFVSLWLTELLPALLEEGMGVVFNPVDGGRPDWVLNYGDLVAFNETKSLTAQTAPVAVGGGEPGSVMVAAPSERLFPKQARKALRRFLVERCNIEAPKVLLVSEASGFQALAFNMFEEEFAPKDFEWLMRMIQWHLPRHVNLVTPHREAFAIENYLPL